MSPLKLVPEDCGACSLSGTRCPKRGLQDDCLWCHLTGMAIVPQSTGHGHVLFLSRPPCPKPAVVLEPESPAYPLQGIHSSGLSVFPCRSVLPAPSLVHAHPALTLRRLGVVALPVSFLPGLRDPHVLGSSRGGARSPGHLCSLNCDVQS